MKTEIIVTGEPSFSKPGQWFATSIFVIHSGVFAVGVFESSGSSSLDIAGGTAKGRGLCKVCRGGLAWAGLNGSKDPKRTCWITGNFAKT